MTTTVIDVANKKPAEQSAEQQAAVELVRLAKEQGLSLTGPDGPLKQLTKTVLGTALNEEMTEHLGYEKHDWPAPGPANIRNGTRGKTVLTENTGQVEIEVPRDRAGTFTPQIVKKRQCRLNDVGEVVLSIYAKGRILTGRIRGASLRVEQGFAADEASVFELIRNGMSGQAASIAVGVSPSCGSLWFINADRETAGLNFYSTRPHAFNDESIATAAIFGTFAALTLRAADKNNKVANLEQALDFNRNIGTAIASSWVANCGRGSARSLSSAQRAKTLSRKLRDIADDVIVTGELPDVPVDRRVD